jgi:hypothetical protein
MKPVLIIAGHQRIYYRHLFKMGGGYSLMRIFLSHASEDRTVAEAQLALAAAGHDVFFDDQSLRAAMTITRIRDEVKSRELSYF